MKKFSNFEKFSFKQIMGFCLFLIAMNVLNLIKSLLTEQGIHTVSTVWASFAIGLILIYAAIIYIKYALEKIAVIFFGFAVLLHSFRKFVGYPTTLLLSILLMIIGTYFFWVANKAYKRGLLKRS